MPDLEAYIFGEHEAYEKTATCTSVQLFLSKHNFRSLAWCITDQQDGQTAELQNLDFLLSSITVLVTTIDLFSSSL